MATSENTMAATIVNKIVITQENRKSGMVTLMELPFEWLESCKLPENSRIQLYLPRRGRYSEVFVINGRDVAFYDQDTCVLMTKRGKAYKLCIDESDIFRGRKPQYYGEKSPWERMSFGN